MSPGLRSDEARAWGLLLCAAAALPADGPVARNSLTLHSPEIPKPVRGNPVDSFLGAYARRHQLQLFTAGRFRSRYLRYRELMAENPIPQLGSDFHSATGTRTRTDTSGPSE